MRFKYLTSIRCHFILLFTSLFWLFLVYLKGYCSHSSDAYNSKILYLSSNYGTKRLLDPQHQFKPKFQNIEKRNSPNLIYQEKHAKEILPYIYAVTPTYERLTQKADLTRLCQTLKHVKNMHWILIEDAEAKRNSTIRFLENCGVTYTHLAIRTRPSLRRGKKDPRWKKHRGVEQRNAGLTWLRQNIKSHAANGVVYFVDDDNTYDLEIFEQMRWTKKVSIWPVGFTGAFKWAGPICKSGKVLKFWTLWKPQRRFPVDMAGFAFNLKLILDKSNVSIDVNAPPGYLETNLLESLVSKEDLEPLADNCKKILVWHTRTAEPIMKRKDKFSDPPMEV